MMRNLILAGGALAAFALAVGAQANRALADDGSAPDVAGLVAARQAGMTMSVFTMGALGQAEKGEGPLGRSAFPASGLASLAEALPTLFAPATAEVTGSRALPAVWQDSAGFAARVAEFRSATGELAAAAKADDRAAFSAALARTRGACQACHDQFRAGEG